jgi:hypothetical protein
MDASEYERARQAEANVMSARAARQAETNVTAARAEGQRKINLIWELTQAVIALLVTATTLYASAVEPNGGLLSNGFFLVIGFYFGRTNHSRTGSVGETR